MFKAVFFDFWGTLVENGTYSPLKQTYKILEYDGEFGEFVEKFESVFMTAKYEDQTKAFEAACDAISIQAQPFEVERLIGIWNKNKLLAKPYPDTASTLQDLKDKGIKVVLVSNCPQDSVEQVLETHNLKNLFDGIHLSYKEGKLKTTGLIEIALSAHDLKPEEVLFVGDSIESDMKGAEKAGLKGCLIDRKDRREYPLKIRTLSSVKQLLEGA